jgi:pilus assembly protein TadC
VVLAGALPRWASATRLGPLPPTSAGQPGVHSQPGVRARRMASALAGVGTAVLVPPPPLGVLTGVVVALALPRVLIRLEPGARRRERTRLRHDLPLAADLFASCVLGGADPAQAAQVVAAAVAGPLGARLDTVARALRLGLDPVRAWTGLAEVPELVGWARTCARAASTGAPLAGVVVGIADDARARRRTTSAAAARRAGVLATLPLGLCFLPAFVLIGVVPLIASFVGPLLEQLG